MELVDLGPGTQHSRSQLAIGTPVWIPGAFGKRDTGYMLIRCSTRKSIARGRVLQQEITAKDHAPEVIYMGPGKFKGAKIKGSC